MQNRRISSNIHKVLEVIQYTQKHDKPGLIMSIDFEKCFDCMEYNVITGSLRYFGFGEKIIEMIKVLLNDFQLCTQNNGEISEWFNPSRAMRQGCPISSYLFLCCSEVKAHLLRAHIHIKGIEIYDLIALISQFADDTMLFLSFEESYSQRSFETIDIIEHNIGLKVNYDKTNLYRIGSISNTDAKLYTQKEFK